MKKSLSKIIVFVGFLWVCIGELIDGFSQEAYIQDTLLTTGTLLGALAVVFVFAKNKTLSNMGYALCACGGISGILICFKTNLPIFAAIGYIIMLIGAAVWLIGVLVAFFGFVKGGYVSEDDVSSQLIKYKELEKEEIISAEEFEKLKAALFAGSDGGKVTLNDLKKWKKLCDDGVITADEFAAFKAKALGGENNN